MWKMKQYTTIKEVTKHVSKWYYIKLQEIRYR